jgi:uncharacterized membrane protein YfcA
VDAATIALVAVATFAIGVVGSLAGLVLGNLRLPLLLAVLPAATAGGTNILVSGAGAAAGAAAHIRAGHFDRHAFVWMAPASVAGALLGGTVAGILPEWLLISGLAVIILQQGALLVRSASRPPQERAPPSPARLRAGLIVAGLVIGVLGGLVGLILGTLRLPAMLRLGVGIRDATSTNLAVGVLVGAAGGAAHFLTGTADVPLALLLFAPAIAGGVAGARMANRMPERTLRRAIGTVMLAVAVVLAATLAVGLRG